MQVLVTGAGGFIGQNLVVHLREMVGIEVLTFRREDDEATLRAHIERASAIIHLAGANRPDHGQDFTRDTVDLTRRICTWAADRLKPPAIFFASSTQAEANNPYGQSKCAAEESVRDYAARSGAIIHIERLPNIFGKWCKPNYNSVFATFCYNIARDLPIICHDRGAQIQAAYVDDVCAMMIAFLTAVEAGSAVVAAEAIYPVYRLTVGEIADTIAAMHAGRATMMTDRVGGGFLRALHATYLSYLPPSAFGQALVSHSDRRGRFVEMLKTPDSGQFSFFTAGPGITRGGHYHHSKTEKFLVLQGRARFRFEHLVSGEHYEIVTDGEDPMVVDTIPGWTHDITNISDQTLFVMLWANEIFDRARPDTYARAIQWQ